MCTQVLGFVFTAAAVVARSAQMVTERGDWADIALFHWDYQALFAIPIVVFGFNCHANVVTIFSCATLNSSALLLVPAAADIMLTC